MDELTIKAIHDIPYYTGENEIPGIRFRPIRKALGVRAWGMNVIEIDPHNEGYPEHNHEQDGQEEVYVILEGSATLVVADDRTTVTKGQLVRVPSVVTRKFVTEDQGVVLLAIGGTPGRAYEAPAWES